MIPEQVKAIFPWATQREQYTWEYRLWLYSQPQWRRYAIQDLIYTKAVAEDRAKQGLDITDQMDWANKIRMAAGLPDYLYGPQVTSDQAYQNYLNEYPTQPPQQPPSQKQPPSQRSAQPTPGLSSQTLLLVALGLGAGILVAYLIARKG